MTALTEHAIRHIEKSGTLPIFLRIFDDRQRTPIQVDAASLDAMAFVVSVAEFHYCYCLYRLHGQAQRPYSEQLFKAYHAEIILGLRRFDRTFVDLDGGNGMRYMRYFAGQLTDFGRSGLYLSRGELLHAALVEAFKENPDIRKIVVGGVTGAIVTLSLVIGGVCIMDKVQEADCRREAAELMDEQLDVVARQERLEGRMSQHHVKARRDILNSYNAAVLSCRARIPSWGFGASERGIDANAGASDERKYEK